MPSISNRSYLRIHPFDQVNCLGYSSNDILLAACGQSNFREKPNNSEDKNVPRYRKLL